MDGLRLCWVIVETSGGRMKRIQTLCILVMGLIHSGADAAGTNADRGYIETRTDFNGTPFTYSVPVQLPDAPRPAPRLKGNWYTYEPQSALQAVNLRRFPEFASDPYFAAIYNWKLFRTRDTFDVLKQGFTHVARQDEYIGDSLPQGQRAGFYSDAYFYKNAVRWADELVANNPDDKRIRYLRALGMEHRMVVDEDTCHFLGEKMWDDAKNAYAYGKGCGILTIDIETDMHSAIGHPEDMFGGDSLTMMGLIFREAYKIAEAEGKPFRIFGYGYSLAGSWAGGWGEKVPNGEAYKNLNHDFQSGDPAKPFNNHPMIQAYQLAGGYIGVDKYMRNTWGPVSYYDQNPDGSYVMQDGRRVYRTADLKTTYYGQEIPLSGHDTSGEFLGKEAESVLRFYLMDLGDIYTTHFWLNGGKSRRKLSDKVDPWKTTEMGRWLRYDTEPILSAGARFGERPIYDKLLTATIVQRSFLCGQWFWQAEGLGNLGEKGPEKLQSKGAVEAAVYARHRVQNIVEPFMRDYDDFYFVRPIRGFNEIQAVPGNDPQEGPIMGGWLAGRSFAFYACYVAQDETEADARDVIFWYDDGVHVSPAYKFRLENRDTVIERIELPDVIPEETDPRYLRFQFTDINGREHTWSGDYEFPVIGTPKPPQLYNGVGTL